MKKKELLNLILSKIIEFFYKRAEFKKIKENRRKKIYEKISLSDVEKNEIDKFYLENYGKKYHMSGIDYINLIQENLMKNIFQNFYTYQILKKK